MGLANRYLGTVISSAAAVPARGFNVRYFVDGEADPCFEELWEDAETPYAPNAAAKTAAQKPNCLEVACWFADAACTKAYSTKVLEADLDLYAYNRCSLEYGTTDRSCVLDDSYSWKADEALTRPLALSELYPAKSVVKYGTDVRFAGPWKAYCLDMGETRTATSGGRVLHAFGHGDPGFARGHQGQREGLRRLAVGRLRRGRLGLVEASPLYAAPAA